MNATIYTPYDCLIKTSNEEIYLPSNQHLEIQINDERFYIYPTGQCNIIPFRLDLNTDSIFYKVATKSNNLFVFLIDGIFAQNIEIHSFVYNGKKSEIEISPQNICFSSSQNKKNISLPFPPQNSQCGIFKHINYALLSFPEKMILATYNTLNGKAKIFQGKKITLGDNFFEVVYDDNKNHSQSFVVDSEGIKRKDSFYQNTPSNFPHDICQNFMSFLKQGEYSLAFDLLSDNLRSQPQEALTDFFGEVSYFYLLDSSSVFCLSNGKGKIFDFVIEQGKIVDILDE